MKKFKEFVQLHERILSPGFKPEHEEHREKHRQEIHDMLRNAYANLEGGYSGMGAGSKEESDAIHDDISNSAMKIVKRNGKVSAVTLYKKKHGRKTIALATDGTKQGKDDVKSIMRDDQKDKRSWAELSDAPEHMQRKMGFPAVSSDRAAELTGKTDVDKEDDEYYTRKIGGQRHRKVILGYPKKDT